MDENLSPVSTPSDDLSPRHQYDTKTLLPFLQTKTNITRSDLSLDSKKVAVSMSPVRSPLRDKNTTVIIPPQTKKQEQQKATISQQKPSLKNSSHHHTAPPAIQQFPYSSSPTSPSSKYYQHEQHPYISYHQLPKSTSPFVVRSKSPKPSPSTAEAILLATSAAAAEAKEKLASSNSWNLTERILAREERTLAVQVKEKQDECDTLVATLENEKRRTADIRLWEQEMMKLVQQFNDIQHEIDDSLDVLVEFDQTMDALAQEQQQDMRLQNEIDLLMNMIPEKLFEIETLKSKLK